MELPPHVQQSNPRKTQEWCGFHGLPRNLYGLSDLPLCKYSVRFNTIKKQGFYHSRMNSARLSFFIFEKNYYLFIKIISFINRYRA